MTPGEFVALAATLTTIALTPGPAVTAIVARAIADGVRPALALSLGVLSGDLLFLALAAAGMAAASSMSNVFTVLRWVGALYLAWQGIALWRTPPRVSVPLAVGAHEANFWRNYGAGLLLMFGHVQAMLFYAALLPGFVDLARPRAADLGVVAGLLVLIIGGVNAGYAMLAAKARRFFADARAQRALNVVAGTLMLVAAVIVVSRV